MTDGGVAEREWSGMTDCGKEDDDVVVASRYKLNDFHVIRGDRHLLAKTAIISTRRRQCWVCIHIYLLTLLIKKARVRWWGNTAEARQQIQATE